MRVLANEKELNANAFDACKGFIRTFFFVLNFIIRFFHIHHQIGV